MAKSKKKISTNIFKSYKNPSTIEKLLGVLLVLFIGTMVLKYRTGKNTITEGFEESKEVITKKGPEVYDDFYAKFYDNLLYNKIKNKFEVESIVNTTSPTSQSIILDIGSGTGHHVNEFAKLGCDVMGIDISPAMVSLSMINYPNSKFKQQDALDQMAFPGSSYTHITCLYFTLYYIKDKNKFFSNCFYWLKPGGYLVIHLVNKHKFDPILPAGDPFVFVSPQKYAKKRIMSTEVKFVGYDYKSNFEIFKNDDTAVFNEIFKDTNTGEIRKQQQVLYMPTQKKILNIAKDNGFIMLSQTDMTKCKYEDQFLYVLQKPN
jgi:SAM-dependent methyltransferase